jgi:hypothetical protein
MMTKSVLTFDNDVVEVTFALINDKLDQAGYRGRHDLRVADKPEWPKQFLANGRGEWIASGYIFESGVVEIIGENERV